MKNYWLKKSSAYGKLLRLHRPAGFLLLLWPTYWGLWIAANGRPPLKILIIFTLGVIVMRSAGCVINDIFDRHYDSQVQRTCQRPLATGALSVVEALIVFFCLCGTALMLVLMLNPLTFWLALLGLGITVLYPLLKRVTHLPQLGLGCAFSWGIPLAFAAQTAHVPAVACLLVLINCLWAISYDTQYAMVDREDDIKIGVKSTAVLFAEYDRLMILLLQGLILLLFLVLAYSLQLDGYFYAALTVAGLLFAYQQWLMGKVNTPFYQRALEHNQWFGMVIFIGLLVG